MKFVDTIIVLDFETEGLSPAQGCRVIEVGATKLESGRIVGKYSTLMNPGRRLDPNITSITGITDEMLIGQPTCEEGMAGLFDFINGHSLVAHNRSFDKKFLDNELNIIGKSFTGDFFCSLLLARRVWPDIKKYSVSELLKFLDIYTDGSFHRAQWDADVTVKIWLAEIDNLKNQLNRPEITPAFVHNMCLLDKKKAQAYIKKWAL